MKKICAILLSALMLVSLCVPAGAFELEAVETVKETTDPSETDTALTAVDPLLRPGSQHRQRQNRSRRLRGLDKG